MKFLEGDFFKLDFTEKFDGVICDPPYKGVTASNCPVEERLGELQFSIPAFMKKANDLTVDDSFLICFCNLQNGMDLCKYAGDNGWKFSTYQIWDKQPTRNWISWQMPLRHCELIFYFKKGNFKFDFRNGEVKKGVRRNSFGGKLKASKKNESAVSYGMFQEIVQFKLNNKLKVHPTEKPVDFSKMFAKIVGGETKKILDPFCGSGNLLSSFPNSIGIDLKNWRAQ